MIREDLAKITVPMDKFELRGYKPAWVKGKAGYQAILTGRLRTTPIKEVEISKVDLAGKELPGAKIQILKDGKVIDNWTSAKEAHKSSLAEGEYTFHEEAAPEGHTVVTDIKFKVESNGNVKVTSKNSTDIVKEEGNKLTVTDKTKHIDPKGKLQTTVKVNGQSSTTTKSIEIPESSTGVQVKDTITYEGLTEGKEYNVTGQLYEVKDGQVVGEAKAVKTETKKADKSKGNWDLDFGNVTGLEAGKSYVV
ncbi:Cna protein B-type domain protein, partial [Gemella bergeri ATCC 700627]